MVYIKKIDLHDYIPLHKRLHLPLVYFPSKEITSWLIPHHTEIPRENSITYLLSE